MNQIASQHQFDTVAALITRWRFDAVAFVREALHAEPDVWQRDALEALIHEDRISIRSGHGVGKSTFLSWALVWFLCTRYPAKVICTAPSAHQLHDILWSEVSNWLRRMDPIFSEQFYVKADKIELVGGALECFAVARTARKEAPDALQGFHGENLLFIVDEASGVFEVIFEVASGALSTKGAKQLLTGNPLRRSGYFFRSHQEGSGFYRMHVKSTEAKQVDAAWLEKMGNDYGVDSNIYKIRVLGDFPDTDEDTLIPYHLIESACNRDMIVPRAGAIWGVDVARYGSDSSTLVKRFPRGVVDEPIVWNQLNTMEVAGRIFNEWETTSEISRPNVIYVDSIGIGAGVVDRLSELGLPAVGINVSDSSAVLIGQAFRMRDELWMLTLQWFESLQVKLFPHPRLVLELSSIRKGYTSSGKTRIESKDDLKKRTLRSPDVGDALALTFAYSSGMQFMGSAKLSDWSKPINKRRMVGVV